MFTKAFAGTGLTAKVHERLNVKRDHFMQNNESPMQFGQQMADELGGIFRMEKGKAEIVPMGKNADGSSRGTIYAVRGHNLIGWRVHLKISRQSYSRGEQQTYDHAKGALDRLTRAFNNPMGSGEEGGAGQTSPAATQSQGEQQNQGSDNEAESAIADGKIVINGEPRARFGCWVELKNARPQVDGMWLCPSVEHIYSREGYITWLDVTSTRHVARAARKSGVACSTKPKAAKSNSTLNG